MPEFKDFAGLRTLAGRQVVFWIQEDRDDVEAAYRLTALFQIPGATVKIKLGFSDGEAMREAFAKTMSGETDGVWEAQIKKMDWLGVESIDTKFDPEMN